MEPGRRDPRPPGRLLLVAGGPRRQSATGAVEPDVGGDGQGDDADEGHGEKSHRRAEPVLEAGVDRPPGRRAKHQGNALEDAEGGDGRNHR